MKKTAIVLVVLMISLAGKVFAGDIHIDFVSVDSKSGAFVNEFKIEIQKKKNNMENLLIGEYFVRVYVGSLFDEDTGELRSVIGIFINDQENFNYQEKPIFKIWLNDLFSRDEIIKKARKAADDVFEYLERKEGKRKKSIKIPV